MAELTRREFVKQTVAGGVGLGLMGVLGCRPDGSGQQSATARGPGGRRPNVILLMSDQHRAMSMGAYGSTEVRTPHLDALAAESVIFTRAYCQYPQCVASRQSILTGQYPNHHGAYGIQMKSIDPGQWTLPQAFGRAGYRTVLIGHPHSNENGYQDNRNSARHAEEQPQAVKDIVKGPFFGFQYKDNVRTAAPLAFPEEYLPDTYIWQETLRFLKEPPKEPFFLYVSFPKPHPPFNPPQRFWDLYQSDQIVLPPIDPNQPRSAYWGDEVMSDGMKRNYLHGYYACISFIDWCLGNILGALRQAGYFENSIMAYTSDHGENGGYHTRYEKHCFYEPAVRVPLVVRTPATGPRRVEEIVEIMDLAPTFTSLCQVPTGDHQYDAASLEGLLKGDARGWKDWAISEYYQKIKKADGSENTETDLGFGRMLVQGDFKCCIHGNMVFPNSLFNLRDDPDEIRNLWDDPAHRELRDRMTAMLRRDWRREWYPYKTTAAGPKSSPAPGYGVKVEGE